MHDHLQDRPDQAAIRQLAESAPPALAATQYIGISPRDAPGHSGPGRLLTNRYPLIDMGWKRTDCIEWLDANYPGHPVKHSAVIFTGARSTEGNSRWPAG